MKRLIVRFRSIAAVTRFRYWFGRSGLSGDVGAKGLMVTIDCDDDADSIVHAVRNRRAVDEILRDFV